MIESSALGEFGLPDIGMMVAGHTDPGRRRQENQDNFLIGELSGAAETLVLRPGTERPAARTAKPLKPGERGLLLLVADGMGGAAAGRLASGLVCTFVYAELQEGWATDRDSTPDRFAFRLREAVERANVRIHAHATRNPECAGMGSTVTLAGVLSGYLYLVQVGDSRAYLVRGGVATQLTRDQSLVQQMLDAGAITAEAAENSAHGNVILQALGVEPTVEVDLTYQELRRDDFLLLCSDGLHRVVGAPEMAAAVGRLAEPAAVCEAMIQLANDRGGPDNVTAVAASFVGAGLLEPRSGDTVGHTAYPVSTRELA